MSVWLIYVLDHLIDTAHSPAPSWEPPRKLFCRRHWYKFLLFALAISRALVCAFYFLPPSVARGGWLLSLGVLCYFVLIHIAPSNWRHAWPREIFVATFFSLGTFGVAALASPQHLPNLFLAALLFTLCWMNCVLIESQEWQVTGSHAANRPNAVAPTAAHLPLLFGAPHRAALRLARLSACNHLLFSLAVSLADWPSPPSPSTAATFVPAISPAADLALCSPPWPYSYRAAWRTHQQALVEPRISRPFHRSRLRLYPGFSQPLFGNHFTYHNFEVWSDRPISPKITQVLDDAARRLQTSSLFQSELPIKLFFCNSSWRLWLYSQHFNPRLGGLADGWLTHNVYLRASDMAANRLFPPGSQPLTDAAQRPLSYFVAHKATHILEARAFGRFTLIRSPQWLTEGYADYIAKAGECDFAENRRRLLYRKTTRSSTYRRSGLYRRFPTRSLLPLRSEEIQRTRSFR